ncbi:hypothetical protein BV898_15639 [Hypsibius exemplaris]|uniref:J domain-containing protein n=1 Tax=Hypsibius exemplaris TaxID=2072580 RepID=A0A9X6NKK0_HYPEX|nr:hypothetical protein BV898_15639 [Hypsibius exemplaris]
MALVLHPDKNKAPGLGETFKMIGKAYAVLWNPQKKSDYDAGGENYKTVQLDSHFVRQQGRRRYYHSENFMFFEDDASADDFFNVFFMQGFNRFAEQEDDGHRHGVHARRGDRDATRHSSGSTLFLQLSPLLLFLGLSLLKSLT